MMFAGTAGFLLLIIAAILVVQALSKPKPRSYGTLTTAWAHFLNEGDTITVPRDGVCVVTKVVSSTTIEYEPVQVRHGGE